MDIYIYAQVFRCWCVCAGLCARHAHVYMCVHVCMYAYCNWQCLKCLEDHHKASNTCSDIFLRLFGEPQTHLHQWTSFFVKKLISLEILGRKQIYLRYISNRQNYRSSYQNRRDKLVNVFLSSCCCNWDNVNSSWTGINIARPRREWVTREYRSGNEKIQTGGQAERQTGKQTQRRRYRDIWAVVTVYTHRLSRGLTVTWIERAIEKGSMLERDLK